MESCLFSSDILSEILTHVPAGDHWLLRHVCIELRDAIPLIKNDDDGRRPLESALTTLYTDGAMATIRMVVGKPSCCWIDVLKAAATAGDVDTIDLILKNGHVKSTREAFVDAICAGHLKAAKRLAELCSSDGHDIVCAALQSPNKADMIRWIRVSCDFALATLGLEGQLFQKSTL